MKKNTDWVMQLSPGLFWDVDQYSVDPDHHARWITERVMQRGRWEDWLHLKTHYDKELLKSLQPELHLDPKSANFLDLWCNS